MKLQNQSLTSELRPRRAARVCYNCKHWHKKKYNHCQHSGPWGGDITGDPNCTFETNSTDTKHDTCH